LIGILKVLYKLWKNLARKKIYILCICIINRDDEIKEIFSEIENAIKSKEYKVMWIFYCEGNKKIDKYSELTNYPNVIIVNAKWRLVNDVFTSLITLPSDKW
jgi:hypothetical protein